METVQTHVLTPMAAICVHVQLVISLPRIIERAMVSVSIQTIYARILIILQIIFIPSDTNECSTNNGNCSQICTNTNGSYMCSCVSGYQLGSNNRSCNGMHFITGIVVITHFEISDINECSSNNGNCSQLCANTNGSYVCSCASGYQLGSNNRSCNGMHLITGILVIIHFKISDINECSSNNGNCSQLCANTNGSYVCSCASGYQLGSNNRSCNGMHLITGILVIIHFKISDINECSSNNGNCSQLCANTNGSYVCSCYSGFMISVDNRTCIGKFCLVLLYYT